MCSVTSSTARMVGLGLLAATAFTGMALINGRRRKIEKRKPDSVTTILVVRHGETPRNKEGKKIQGQIDDAAAQLNENGRAQADELGKKLSERFGKLTTIYTSPLGRAEETAKIVRKYFPESPVVQDRHFLEISHGPHENSSFEARNKFCLEAYAKMDELLKATGKAPDPLYKWKFNPLSLTQSLPGEGVSGLPLERTMDVYQRAHEGMEEMANRHPNEVVLVVSHAAVIHALCTEAEFRERGDTGVLPVHYEPKPKGSRMLPGNCVVCTFQIRDGKRTFKGSEDLVTRPIANT